jgi:hypothetical protein
MENNSNEKGKTMGIRQQIFNICGNVYTAPGISHMQLIPCGGLQEVYVTLTTGLAPLVRIWLQHVCSSYYVYIIENNKPNFIVI